ncbi:MAG TPA: M12 family metallopeptidase, partial [Planctomycetota bacterium]|nr:M12 family metallopeptidase [Planctomycetota bacterium]
MIDLSPPRQGRATNAALLGLLLLASLTSPLFSQTIPPGFTQVDCMVLPDDVIYGDSVFTASAWPGGAVFVQFDSSISASRRDDFRKAMAEIEAISAISFIESAGPLGHIRVIPNSNSNNVSYSSVGWQGVIQDLAVGANHWDDKYILVHELFHALGYLHEQSRIDRDNYVTINFNNISTTACNGDCSGNFVKNIGALPVGPYDFQSIMHYGPFAFAINNNIPTITAKPGYTQFQNLMGNRSFMTALDAQGIAQRYGGPSQPTVSSISPTSVVAGSAGFWLTVNGTNFFEGSFTNDGVQGTKVVWDGSLLETEWISKTQVRAWIEPSRLTSADTLQVLVQNDVLAGYRPATSETFTITTPPCGTSNDRVGHAVKGVGDVTGDGVPDYIVGAPGHGSNAGRLYMYSGATGNLVWTHTGTSGQQLGWGIAVFEDITGDGRKDILVGMPGANSSSGGWKILSGSNGSILASYTYGVGIAGFGEGVAVIGDIDNDGDQEFIVGGNAYNNLQGRVEVWSVNGGLIRAHNGPAGTSRFGASVGGGYDVSGDGVPDYVVGSPWFPGAAGASSGRISIYSGATGGLLASREGDGASDYLGTSCAIVPGVGGTATASVVAGAPDYGNLFANDGGTGYVRVYNGASVLIGLGYTTRYTIYGTANGDRFGTSVSDGGDVDDDGRTDLLIGAVQGGIGGTGSTGTGYVQIHSGVDGGLL